MFPIFVAPRSTDTGVGGIWLFLIFSVASPKSSPRPEVLLLNIHAGGFAAYRAAQGVRGAARQSDRGMRGVKKTLKSCDFCVKRRRHCDGFGLGPCRWAAHLRIFVCTWCSVSARRLCCLDARAYWHEMAGHISRPGLHVLPAR